MATKSSEPAGPLHIQLRDQWTNPSDILSVLLIVGSDVIKIALTQFNRDSFRPVAFSYGWVAYAYSYLLTTVGGLKSRPDAEFPCVLVNCQNGKTWDRTSWLLGRLLNNYEDWMPKEVLPEKERVLGDHWNRLRIIAEKRGEPAPEKPKRAGLAVAVFEPSFGRAQGAPRRDRVVWTGYLTTVVQLGVAAIPCGLHRDWAILMITAAGTLLAWLTGFLQERSMPERKETPKTFVLTKGNGYQDAIVILGNKHGLDLEDLANEVSEHASGLQYKLSVGTALVLVFLWTALLITTSGLQTHTWYLVCIGGIGMLQNIYVAGAQRHPSAYGIHLDLVKVIADVKVMSTLLQLEEEYPDVGRNLLPVMFPGPLRQHETEQWDNLERRTQRSAES